MEHEQLNFSLLSFFKTLMETKFLSQAADALDISQPTASRNLARLRVIFKDPLFVRTRHGMVPTTKAKELYPEIIKTIFCFDELLHTRQNDPQEFRGVIRIAAVDNGLMLFISKVIKEVMARAPDLEIEVVPLPSDLYEKIESGTIQIAIYPDAPLPADFHQTILMKDHGVCVVHKNHPLAVYAQLNRIPPIEEINKYKRIKISIDGNQSRQVTWSNPYQKASPKNFITTPYFLGIPWLLEDNELTAVVASQTAKHFCRYAPLVILPAPEPYQIFQARMIWHHCTHKNTTLKWLRQLIIEESKKYS